MRSRVLAVLGAQVLGIYLFGSLATGDFDAGVSDIDMLVVPVDELTDSTRAHLRDMHGELADERPAWRDRIEVIHLAAEALSTFRTTRSPLSVTSPGEPFHTIDASGEWLVNWFNVQRSGRALYGPEPGEVMPDVTVAEVRQELRQQLKGWMSRVDGHAQPGFLAYAVLTTARAWDTITNGVVRSKAQSAAVLKEAMPEWAGLLDDAVSVRASRGNAGEVDPEEIDTGRVTQFVADIGRRVG